ncbi:MAG: ornithine--oxo-acid transaminase [Candidatus Eisenbacteria bacterium]|nr:ornithine--oxo-acid transaminase [Candidatus Eisenbacteria bacterium]
MDRTETAGNARAPGAETARHDALVQRYSARNYAPLPVVIAKASGCWVEDVDGHRYLDMLSAYSALNFGHGHPEIVEAFVAQARVLALTSRAFQNDQFGPFCEEITQLAGQDQVLPMNSGAEGVETALKTARKWGYQVKGVAADRAEIIVCAGNFHGRTITIVSFSDDPQFREGFGPFTPGFRLVPYGDAAALEAAIGPNTVGFLVEPIQGEGGIVVPPAGYLKQAREICARHRVLFIADEIQTGLGRTGRLFACDHEGVKPDVLILGKALGGGLMPVSAVLASREVLGVFRPGDHGSTFGGNPLACAVARVAMKVLTRDRLAERAASLGAAFLERLRGLRSSRVKEVRGRGLLIGIELLPDAGPAKDFAKRLKQEGILCKDTVESVLRIAPPLVIEQKDLDWATERIAKVLG